jgi:PAS domain S-box-containing protein
VSRPPQAAHVIAGAQFAALSHDLMAALDADGAIAWANPAWLRLLGWPPAELRGRALAHMLHPDDADAVAALIGGREAALRVRTRSGGERRVAFSTLAAPEEGLVYLCGRDAAETLELELELRAAEDRFRVVTEATSDAILISDGRGRITFANAGVRTVFDWEPHELLGQPFTILLPERRRAVWASRLEHFLGTGEADLLGRVLELEGVRRDGTEFPMEASLGFWERLGRRAFTGILRDVSERRRTQSQLERSNAELAEFAYVASHDLSEPLRTIASYLELLRRRHGDSLSAEADEFVSRAVDGAGRMRALIEDLLAYSRTGRSERPLEPVDLGAIVASIADAVTGDPPPVIEWDDLPTVTGEPGQLRQLLQNLISNAVKFVAPGTVPHVRVSAEQVRVEPEGMFWRLAVDDNGIGIDPQYAERVFGMFQRLHTRDTFPGTGIGLAIARKVVEHHDGSISAEPRPEGGTRMVFTLPV